MSEKALVSIVMGSDSDLEIMNEAAKALTDSVFPTRSISLRRTVRPRAPASIRVRWWHAA